MKKEDVRAVIEVPESVQATLHDHTLVLEKDKAKNERAFPFKRIHLELNDGAISIHAERLTKKEKKIIGTTKAHINNMIKGLEEGHVYSLKVCSGHFPMNVSVNNKEFMVKNFLGEKQPRVLALRDTVEVTVEGDTVIVKSNNKEVAGQTAADIEKLCTITNRDRRIFQDGIWIVDKDGKKV